jgi:hypothetical protein
MWLQTVSMDLFRQKMHDAIILKEAVMKYAKWISVLMLMTIATVAAAQISVTDRITAQVPFTFVVADHVIPMGQCVILRAEPSGQVLTIRSPGTKTELFAAASLKNNEAVSKAYALVFHRYGNRYYLVGVRLENSRVVYSLAPSGFEKELLAQNLRAGEEVLLALAK